MNIFNPKEEALGLKLTNDAAVINANRIAYPHCPMYTGSMTHGISFTNVIAPVMW